MPSPPALDLISVYAKLDRAKEHVDMLDREIGLWIDSGSHTYTLERNEDLTQLYFIAKMNGPEPDLLRWTIVAGDAINNMRSALDHLVYAIAKYETRNDPTADIEGLAFLIVDTLEKWGDRNNRRRILPLSLPVKDAIESLQPFNRKHPVIPPLLAILRDFSNADKHRLLKLAAAAVTAASLNFTSPNPLPTDVGLYTEPIKDGDIFAILQSPQAEPNLALHSAQFTIEIALWHGLKDGVNPMLSKTRAVFLLNTLLDEARFAVMEVVAAVV